MPAKSWPLTDEELRRLYVDEKKSLAQIAELTNKTERIVLYWMDKAGIPRRSKSEGVRLAIDEGRRRPRPVHIPIRSQLVCRSCGASWEYTGATLQTVCPYCGKKKDARDRKDEAKKYAERNPERLAGLKALNKDKGTQRAIAADGRVLLRKRVLFKVSGSISPRCVRCGCDDPRLLEINHKNGGGNRETQKGKQSGRLRYDIATGKRPTDDLELLCKPCNAIHALEMRFGPLPMKVVWSGTQSETPD